MTGAAAIAPPDRGKSLFLHHPQCLKHFTAPSPIKRADADPPPENAGRLDCIYGERYGIIHASEFDAALEWQRGAALSDEELLFCSALLSANMRAQAKAAGWGWSDAAKRIASVCRQLSHLLTATDG